VAGVVHHVEEHAGGETPREVLDDRPTSLVPGRSLGGEGGAVGRRRGARSLGGARPDRLDRGPALRVRDALSVGELSNARGEPHQDSGEPRRRRALAGRVGRRNAPAHPPAADARRRADRSRPGIRRDDEGDAGHAAPAPARSRHPRGRRVGAHVGVALVGRVPARPRDRRRGARPGPRRHPSDATTRRRRLPRSSGNPLRVP